MDAVLAELRALRADLCDRVGQHHVELYGRPADETAPGLVKDVASLKHSRKNLWWGLKAVWALILAAIGYAAAR